MNVPSNRATLGDRLPVKAGDGTLL